MRSDSPSPLSGDERELLDALLAHDFVGVQELREQVVHVRAKSGCDCRCGTIDFVLGATRMPPSDSRSPVPVEGLVVGADGDGMKLPKQAAAQVAEDSRTGHQKAVGSTSIPRIAAMSGWRVCTAVGPVSAGITCRRDCRTRLAYRPGLDHCSSGRAP